MPIHLQQQSDSSVSPNVSKQFTIIYIKTSGANGTYLAQ